MKRAAILILLAVLGCAKKTTPVVEPIFGDGRIAGTIKTLPQPPNLPVSPPDFVPSCQYGQIHCDIQMEKQIVELQQRLNRLEMKYELSRPE